MSELLEHIALTLNGTRRELTLEPRWTLADALRLLLGATGTHVGCEHGICGACTVLLDGRPVRSCLTLGVQADGCHVETVEGLAEGDQAHPLQEAFSRERALQCGFCTPGFLMLAEGLLRELESPSDEQIEDVVASNLCRCGAYDGLVSAVKSIVRQRVH